MTIKELAVIGEQFRLPGRVYSFRQVNIGNINKTYKVSYMFDDGDVKSYMFQKINTHVFNHPVEIMANIDKVTSFIREKNKSGVSLHFHHTRTGENYYIPREGECWRVMNYVDSITFNTCEDPDIIRATGKAFGDFQKVLSDFDASLLFETIPNFHNTTLRLKKLFADEAADPFGRVASVRNELDYIHSVADEVSRLTEMANDGIFPKRVTHNDTKSNNVLFHRITKEPLVVIDLDTVMPGLAMYDFGDAVRFICSTAEEDEPDTDIVELDMRKFKAFTEGFIPSIKDSLTPVEIDCMALGVFSITVELASRFLDDYITGDEYFKVNYEGHNLVRARCQIALAKDMHYKMEKMNRIIRNVANDI